MEQEKYTAQKTYNQELTLIYRRGTMRISFSLLLTLLILISITGCEFLDLFNGLDDHEPEKRIGLVLFGELGDNSFNDMAYAGLQKAKEDLNIDFAYEKTKIPDELESLYREFVEAGYDLVIGIGFLQESAIEAVAEDYPAANLAIVDTVVDKPNVASLLFKEHEGSFLVGALASKVTATDTVGFIGGFDVDSINNFKTGYKQGVLHVNSEVDILVDYAQDFNDSEKGKTIALDQHNDGADVIFHAAGATGLGLFEAAEEQEFYAIGVDTDQDHLAPGWILTSMMKKVDMAVYYVIEKLVAGNFAGGKYELGLAEKAVGTTDFTYTEEKITEDVFNLLDDLEEQIIDGTIEVDSIFD